MTYGRAMYEARHRRHAEPRELDLDAVIRDPRARALAAIRVRRGDRQARDLLHEALEIEALLRGEAAQ